MNFLLLWLIRSIHAKVTLLLDIFSAGFRKQSFVEVLIQQTFLNIDSARPQRLIHSVMQVGRPPRRSNCLRRAGPIKVDCSRPHPDECSMSPGVEICLGPLPVFDHPQVEIFSSKYPAGISLVASCASHPIMAPMRASWLHCLSPAH